MSITKWKVGYIDCGTVKYQNIWWSGQPSEREAATVIKARALQDQRPQGPQERNETVLLTRYYGLEIVEIELADETAANETGTILIVDDNKDSRETLAAVLRIWNYSVTEAEDGPTCIKLASASPPAVILLDIGMPGMNGFEVAQQLRQLPQLANTRIIAVTAFGSLADKQRAARAGFDDHFTKPVVLETLRYQLFPKAAEFN